MTTGNVHDLPTSEFLQEVHSFEFWFHSVESYLSGQTYGHAPEPEEDLLDEDERERLISVLCNYCVAETTALEGASGLVAIAPNRNSKIFLSTQSVDEGRHLEVLLHRMGELGVADPEDEIARRTSSSLMEFKHRLLDLVASKDWEAALLAQNVILEALEFSVFRTHAERADTVTREVLLGIVKDERRHIGFGENELGRQLKAAPQLRARLRRVKEELDHLVLDTVGDTVRGIGIDPDEERVIGNLYLESVHRLGLE